MMKLQTFAALLTATFTFSGFQAHSQSCAEINQRYSCAQNPPKPIQFSVDAVKQHALTTGAIQRYYRAKTAHELGEQTIQSFSEELTTTLETFYHQYLCTPQYTIQQFWGSFHTQAIGKVPPFEFRNSYLKTHSNELKNQQNQFEQSFIQQKQQEGEMVACGNTARHAVATAVSELFDPCVIALTAFLPDNEYRVENYLSEIQASEEYRSGLKCLNGRRHLLKKVTVVSSSNALNNTGGEFCKKDFLGLSKARAERTRDVLLPLILEGQEKEIEVSVDFHGMNRNGTSGPCPYTLTSQGERLIPGFLSNAQTLKKLEKSKYVIIRFEFNSSKMDLSHEPKLLYSSLPCSKVQLSCQ